ncbi:MAG: hypothetical protein ACI9WC_002919, partial [Arenicella sp.]
PSPPICRARTPITAINIKTPNNKRLIISSNSCQNSLRLG